MLKRFVILLSVVAISLLLLIKILSSIDKTSHPKPVEEIVLTSEEGKPTLFSSLDDKPKVVFFGFTNCPNVCPLALANISAAFDSMGDKAKEFYGVFVTTDPERDTPDAIHEFLSPLNNIRGYTGTPDNLQKIYKRYYVYSQKAGEPDKNGNYNLNHSTTIYLLDKGGEMVDHFESDLSPDDIAKKLQEYLKH